MNEVPEIVLEWIKQLREDKMLHDIINAADSRREQMDVELTALMRMSSNAVVMKPRITVRR